jgi:hypothetical protein
MNQATPDCKRFIAPPTGSEGETLIKSWMKDKKIV